MGRIYRGEFVPMMILECQISDPRLTLDLIKYQRVMDSLALCLLISGTGVRSGTHTGHLRVLGMAS